MSKIGINLVTGGLQQQEIIVGIDLGTTNSLIAIVRDDTRQPIALKEIVNELDAKMNVLNGLRKMKTEAQKKINQILADVWGVEFVEPENILVEDEQEN